MVKNIRKMFQQFKVMNTLEITDLLKLAIKVFFFGFYDDETSTEKVYFYDKIVIYFRIDQTR